MAVPILRSHGPPMASPLRPGGPLDRSIRIYPPVSARSLGGACAATAADVGVVGVAGSYPLSVIRAVAAERSCRRIGLFRAGEQLKQHKHTNEDVMAKMFIDRL